MLDMGVGDTLESAMKNATSGKWYKAGYTQKNCAYYVVVGNNLRNSLDTASFAFYRTSAVMLKIIGMVGIVGVVIA